MNPPTLTEGAGSNMIPSIALRLNVVKVSVGDASSKTEFRAIARRGVLAWRNSLLVKRIGIESRPKNEKGGCSEQSELEESMIEHPTPSVFHVRSIAHSGKTGRATSGIIRVSERGFWATSNMSVTCRRLPEIPSRRQASTSAVNVTSSVSLDGVG
jgi:hypothetical protein